MFKQQLPQAQDRSEDVLDVAGIGVISSLADFTTSSPFATASSSLPFHTSNKKIICDLERCQGEAQEEASESASFAASNPFDTSMPSPTKSDADDIKEESSTTLEDWEEEEYEDIIDVTLLAAKAQASPVKAKVQSLEITSLHFGN